MMDDGFFGLAPGTPYPKLVIRRRRWWQIWRPLTWSDFEVHFVPPPQHANCRCVAEDWHPITTGFSTADLPGRFALRARRAEGDWLDLGRFEREVPGRDSWRPSTPTRSMPNRIKTTVAHALLIQLASQHDEVEYRAVAA